MPLFAQTAEETASLAASKETAGDYKEASKLYRRLLFFANYAQEQQYYAKLATCSQLAGDFESAALSFRALRKEAINDSMYSACLLLEYQNQLRADAWPEIIKSYPGIDTQALNRSQRVKVIFYYGLACVKAQQPQDARNAFLKLFPHMSATDSISMRTLLTEYERKVAINPARARYLSLLLPGLGQLSVKDAGNAANSFLLNAALITGCVVTIVHYTVFDGVLFWLPHIGHYYVGGARAAEDLAIKKKRELSLKYYNRFTAAFARANFTRMPEPAE